VYEVRAYAEIYVTMSQSIAVNDVWKHVLDRAETMMHHRLPLGESFKQLMIARVKALRRHFIRNTRKRRGLFNFVGDIGSSLFGIPSASDINALKEVNTQLANELTGVVTVQRKVIGRVNKLGKKQQEIAGVVNELAVHSRKNEEDIWLWRERTGQLGLQIEANTDALRLILQLDIVEESMDEYQELLAEMQAVRVACEARLVTEQVLPTAVVRNLLAAGENHREIPVEQYYAYIKVRKIIEVDGQHYCVLQAPMMSHARPIKIGIHTFPVCQDAQCIQLYQPKPFVIDYATEELYFPEQCYGPTPQACQPGVRYDKGHQTCLHGLVNGDGEQQLTCPITYFDKPPPAQKIVTDKLNRFILRTKETLYHYRCPQRIPVVGRIAEGSYVIDVEPHCILDANMWMLQGLPIIETNYTRQYLPPMPLNLSWFVFPDRRNDTLVITLPKGIDRIEVPSYGDLQALPGSDINSKIEELQKNIGKTSIAWWIWIIIAFMIISLMSFVFVCLRQTRCLKGACKRKAERSAVRYQTGDSHVSIQQQTDGTPDEENDNAPDKENV